jgi:hypothetical protein
MRNASQHHHSRKIPHLHTQQYRYFNGKTFGIWHGLLDHRISSNTNVSKMVSDSNPAVESESAYLWLCAARVGDKKGTVVCDEGGLQLVLCVLIDELLVVGDEGLGDGLTDGVDLGSVSTTGDADADVDASELVEANNQERLVKLWAKDVRNSFPLQNLKIPPSHSRSPGTGGEGEIYLEAEDLWLDQVERLSVNLNKTLSGLYTHTSSVFHSFHHHNNIEAFGH